WEVTDMKPTDFATYLTQFLSDYLPGQKNVSPNTIRSYRDTFKLLLQYFQEQEGIAAESITMSCLIQERIISFLDWLETERRCAVSTLYDSGARVQELIDLSVGDAHPRCQCGSCPDRKRQQDTPCPADEEYRQPACRLPFGKPSGWSTQEDIPALYKQPAQPTDKGG